MASIGLENPFLRQSILGTTRRHTAVSSLCSLCHLESVCENIVEQKSWVLRRGVKRAGDWLLGKSIFLFNSWDCLSQKTFSSSDATMSFITNLSTSSVRRNGSQLGSLWAAKLSSSVSFFSPECCKLSASWRIFYGGNSWDGIVIPSAHFPMLLIESLWSTQRDLLPDARSSEWMAICDECSRQNPSGWEYVLVLQCGWCDQGDEIIHKNAFS